MTFAAVVLSTLVECHPFDHYWQVVPDPGSQCRQGYAQLITMGVCDILTDLLLIAFPIPIIIRSAMGLKRKLSLVALFSLSVISIVIIAYRVPAVVAHHGRQQYRTVFASGEILAAAAVSNAVVLGSFLRNRGVKKTKYRASFASSSLDRPSLRRPTLTRQTWGSDEDLVSGMCYRLDPELQARPYSLRAPPTALPPPTVPPSTNRARANQATERHWQFPNRHTGSSGSSVESDDKTLVEHPPSPKSLRAVASPPNPSFFDVGGLLDNSWESVSPVATTLTRDANAQDSVPPRRGSRALLADLDCLQPLSSPVSQETRTHRLVMWPLPEAALGPQHRIDNSSTGMPASTLVPQGSVRSPPDTGESMGYAQSS